jgi:hypothetical protein
MAFWENCVVGREPDSQALIVGFLVIPHPAYDLPDCISRKKYKFGWCALPNSIGKHQRWAEEA